MKNPFEIKTRDGTIYEADCETGSIPGRSIDTKHQDEVRTLESNSLFLRRVRKSYYAAVDRGY